MKKVLSSLTLALLLPGCAQHYDMTLTNGMRVTNVTRPVLDEESSTYSYKDVAGHQHKVSQVRVLEIKPHSHRKDLVNNGR